MSCSVYREFYNAHMAASLVVVVHCVVCKYECWCSFVCLVGLGSSWLLFLYFSNQSGNHLEGRCSRACCSCNFLASQLLPARHRLNQSVNLNLSAFFISILNDTSLLMLNTLCTFQIVHLVVTLEVRSFLPPLVKTPISKCLYIS